MNDNSRDYPLFSDDAVERIARKVEPHDFDRIEPPPQVWNNVLAELEVALASEEATARRKSTNRFMSPRVLSMVAALVVLVGVSLALFNLQEDSVPADQLAFASLTDAGLQIPTSESAEAVLSCEGQDCFVEVTLTAVPSAGADADLELWLINTDVSDMRSLGIVTQSGRFELPAGVTFEEFPIVDISVEPRDGEATHSGQSMLRGVLAQT